MEFPSPTKPKARPAPLRSRRCWTPGAALPLLRRLLLCCNGAGDRGARAVAEAADAGAGALRALGLGGNGVGAEGAGCVARLCGLRWTRIDLGRNGLSDAAVRPIAAALLRNTRLETHPDPSLRSNCYHPESEATLSCACPSTVMLSTVSPFKHIRIYDNNGRWKILVLTQRRLSLAQETFVEKSITCVCLCLCVSVCVSVPASVCVCVCARARARACACQSVCARASVKIFYFAQPGTLITLFLHKRDLTAHFNHTLKGLSVQCQTLSLRLRLPSL